MIQSRQKKWNEHRRNLAAIYRETEESRLMPSILRQLHSQLAGNILLKFRTADVGLLIHLSQALDISKCKLPLRNVCAKFIVHHPGQFVDVKFLATLIQTFGNLF